MFQRRPAAWALAGVMALALGTTRAEESGLIVHYLFDEGAGTMVRDRSGRNHHGRIVGNAAWVKADGAGALQFYGTNGYVECMARKSLEVGEQAAFAVWFNPAAYQGGLIARQKDNSWQGLRLAMGWRSDASGGPQVVLVTADGMFFETRNFPPPPLHMWTHMAFCYDGITMRQYVNGRLIRQQAATRVPDFRSLPLWIGRLDGLGEKFFSGMIGEVRIYNRPLTDAEVFGIFASGAAARGAAIPAGTERLALRAQTDLESGLLRVAADVAEFRPIPEGMRLRLRIAGTPLEKTLPVVANVWQYETTFEAPALADGRHAAVATLHAADETLAGKAEASFVWRKLALPPDWRLYSAVSDAEAFDLVRDGKPQATLVVPADNKGAAQAAQWLAEYVRAASDAALPIRTEGQPVEGRIVSVGHTQRLKDAGLSVEGLTYDGCRMVVRGDALYLFGRDDYQFANVGPRGTCKAVVTFLEEAVGVRWFLPGPNGTVIPKRDRIAIPRDFDRIFIPAYGYSHGRQPYGANTAAALANNYRTAIKLLSYGGHSYYDWLPAAKYFPEHPEYFALIGGKRVGEGNHLCSSNPDVERILTAGLRNAFDQGYEMVEMGQEDGYVRCECPTCESLDDFRGTTTPETPCERLFLLHKRVVDACRESHPDRTALVTVYGPTLWPSRKFDSWGDTVVAEMCSVEPEMIAAWQDKVRGMTAYLYWFDTTLAAGMAIHATPAQAAARLRTLFEHQFIGLYQIPETNWGLQGPVYYVIGKLMGDPYLDYRAVQREYCLGVFGPEAGDAMDRFFTTLYAMPKNDLYLQSEEDLRALETLLREAEGQAKTTPHREWVKLTREHFDFMQLVSRMLRAYRAYLAAPSDGAWAALASRVQAFEAYRERILAYSDAEADRFFPGHDPFCRFLASEHVGYYESWRASREKALQAGIRGTKIGWSNGGVTAPLTLDFSKPPHKTPGR